MAVEHDPLRAFPQLERRGAIRKLLLEKFLEQHARLGHPPRLPLRVTSQEVRHVLSQGREAARLEEDEARALVGEGKKTRRVRSSTVARFGEQSL